MNRLFHRLIEPLGIALTNAGWMAFHVLALVLFSPRELKTYYSRKGKQ